MGAELKITPEMVEVAERVFGEWKTENHSALFEDGSLGDVADLLRRLLVVLPYETMASS